MPSSGRSSFLRHARATDIVCRIAGCATWPFADDDTRAARRDLR
jgi:hypothetical protein